MHVIPREPSVYAPTTMVHKDVDAMHDDFLVHLVLVEARGIIVPSEWICAFNYIQWYFRVSHYYMTPDVEGKPPRTTHQKILEEEHARAYHVVDVFPACRCIMDIAWAIIDKGMDDNGYPWEHILVLRYPLRLVNMIPVSTPFLCGYPPGGYSLILRYSWVFTDIHEFYYLIYFFKKYIVI